MHSTERAFFLIERNVALHPLRTQPISRGFPLAPAPGEKTAFVFQPLSLNDERTLQFGLNEFQSTPSDIVGGALEFTAGLR